MAKEMPRNYRPFALIWLCVYKDKTTSIRRRIIGDFNLSGFDCWETKRLVVSRLLMKLRPSFWKLMRPPSARSRALQRLRRFSQEALKRFGVLRATRTESTNSGNYTLNTLRSHRARWAGFRFPYLIVLKSFRLGSTQ